MGVCVGDRNGAGCCLHRLLVVFLYEHLVGCCWKQDAGLEGLLVRSSAAVLVFCARESNSMTCIMHAYLDSLSLPCCFA